MHVRLVVIYYLFQCSLTDAVVRYSESLLVLLYITEHSGPALATQWELVRHKTLHQVYTLWLRSDHWNGQCCMYMYIQ